MPTCKAANLGSRLPPGARLLGIDLGEKTIGLAISDGGLTVASPLTTLARAKLSRDAAALAGIVAERGVGGFVLGLPMNMDGSEGRRAQSTRDWAAELLKRIDLPLAFWDERMSTMAVERAMIEADLTRRQRKKHIDESAAAWILQGALDAMRAGR